MMRSWFLIMFVFFAAGFLVYGALLLRRLFLPGSTIPRAGGILISLAGVLIFTFAAADTYLKLNFMAMTAWQVGFWVFSGLGILFSLPGIVEEKGDLEGVPEKRAGLHIAIGVILIAASPFIAVQSIAFNKPAFIAAPVTTAKMEGKVYEFKDLNLKFTAPPSPWIEINMKQWNPDSLAGFMRSKPVVLLHLIAEKNILIEKGDERFFAERVYAAMAEKTEAHNLISTEPYSISGIDGFIFTSEMKVDGQKIYRKSWMGGIAGFFYQMVVFTPEEEAAKDLQKIFGECAAGFSVIDPSLTAGPEPLKENFQSPKYDYKVNAADTGWNKWWMPVSKERVLHLADYKMTQGNTGAFMVFPIFFYDEIPPLEILTPALLKLNRLEFEKIPADSIKPFKQGNYEGENILYTGEVDSGHYHHNIKIFRGKDRAFYVTAYFNLDLTQKINQDAAAKAIEMFEPLEPGALPKPQTLTENEKDLHAKIYTFIGDEYFRQSNKDKGIDYFQKAFEFKSDNLDLFKNVVLSLSGKDYYYEALQFLKRHRKNFPKDRELLYQEAFLNFKIHDYPAAKKLYEEYFDSGKFNYQALSEYMEMMKDEPSKEQAKEKVTQIFSAKSTPEEMSSLAALIDRPEKPDSTIDFLADLYKKHPGNQTVRTQYWYYLLKYSRYEETLSSTTAHLQKYGPAVDVYTNKALALTALKKYLEARNAFVAAQTLAPDTDLNTFIENLTAIEKQSKGADGDWSRLKITRIIEIADDSLSIQEELAFENRWAEEMRGYLWEKDEKDWTRDFNSVLARYFTAPEVKDVKIANLDEGRDKPLKIALSIHVPRGLDKIDRYRTGKMPLSWESHYMVLTERGEFPFQIVAPSQISSSETFQYPPNLKMKHNFSGKVIKQNFSCGEVDGTVEESAGSLTIQRNFRIKGGGYSAKEYDQCRSDLEGVLRDLSAAVLFEE